MNTITKSKNPIKKRKNIIEYVTDEKGIKKKVILPISVYENLLEDLHDIAIVAERKNEGYVSFDAVIKGLKKDGLL